MNKKGLDMSYYAENMPVELVEACLNCKFHDCTNTKECDYYKRLMQKSSVHDFTQNAANCNCQVRGKKPGASRMSS